jgi:hyperosmotically inducible periplasmic protein
MPLIAPLKDSGMKAFTLATTMAVSLAALAPCVAIAAPQSDMDTSQPPPVVVKASSIKSSIRAQLASDPYKGLKHIDVDVNHHGVVSLEGKVPSQDAVDRAVSIARATEGVREVKNQLKIKADD